jgi:hypothetical protein
MHQRIPVITAEAPFRRYAPHPDPMLLEDGAFADVQNVVIDQGLPRVRAGMGAFLDEATEIPDGEFYGGGVFDFGSGRIAVRAIWDGAHIRIECNVSNDGTTWGGWAEATAASSASGDTRMAKPELGLVQFQSVPASNRNSAGVIIQTGKDLPRLLSLGDTETLRIIYPVEPPSGIESHPAIASVVAGVDIASGSATGSGSMGTNNFVITIGGAVGHQIVSFEPDEAAVDVGEWAQVVYDGAGTVDMTESKQAFLLMTTFDDEDPSPWLRHKIYLCNGPDADLQLIYDPEDSQYSAIEVATGTNVYHEIMLVAFNLDGLNLELEDVVGIRFEAVQSNPTGFDLLGILAGGRVNGAASYKVSHHSNWMHSESPGVTLRYGAAAREGDFADIERLELALSETQVATAGQLGLPGVTLGYYLGPPLNLRLPVEPTLYYQFLVPVLSPIEGEGEHGVDEARVYRRDPGEGQYSLVGSCQTAQYDGGWVPFDDGSPDEPQFTEWNQRGYLADNAARESKSFELPAPSAQNTSVPKGYAMAAASSRLYVGATRDSGTSAQSVVYASELDLAMRFRNVNASGSQTIADRDAFVVGLAYEDALALRSSATSAIGIEGLYCWTSRGLYRISDLRAERIGGEGIGAPNSAAEKNGLVLWLDNQNEIQVFAGHTSNLSRGSVESVLGEIPTGRRKFAAGAVWRDVFYLAHADGDSDENRHAFVYSLLRQRFEGRFLVPAGMSPVQFQAWDFDGDTRMLYWDGSGRLWEWMKPGQAQDGEEEAIELSLTTKRYRPSPNGRLAFRRTQIVADDGEATWTVSHAVEGVVDPVVGTIVMPNAGVASLVQVYDSTSGSSTYPVGGAGYSVQTTLSAELPAGTRLCEWVFEGREVQVAAGSAG